MIVNIDLPFVAFFSFFLKSFIFPVAEILSVEDPPERQAGVKVRARLRSGAGVI